MGPQGVGLEHQVQVPLAGRGVHGLRRIDNLLAVHVDEAILGLLQAGDNPEGGGLAAAGGAQQGHEVPVLNSEVQLFQNVVFPVEFIDIR